MFGFAAGNLAKLLRLPLQAGGDLLTHVVPRSPRRWVVGSAFGFADGAARFDAAARRRYPQVRVTWLARDRSELSTAVAQGVPAVLRDSREGFAETLRAGVVVVTHGFGDVNRYATRGAVIVNLWHGSPLKRLHLDSPAALRLPIVGGSTLVRRLMAELYRRGTSRTSVLPVSSHTVEPAMTSAFGLAEGRVVVTGEPRADILFTGTQDERERHARERLTAAVGGLPAGRVVLVAPTWRDGEVDPTIPTESEWRDIESWCAATQSTMVVRPHPLTRGDWVRRGERLRLLDPQRLADVNPVLWAVDVLVTDYSSVLVDFAVTGRPIVFLAPDEESYVRSRGLYRPYGEITGGRVARTWAATLAQVDAVTRPGPERDQALAHSAQVAAAYHPFTDGKNTERALDVVSTALARRFR